MTRKIFRSILIVALIALLACLIIVTAVLYEHFTTIQKDRLKTEWTLAAAGVEQSNTAYLQAVSAEDYRLTWINADGAVLFDTDADAGGMGNHADREEFKEAIASGSGESERYSSTLTAKTLYYAAKLSDGTVLRISVKSVTVITLVLSMLQPILFLFFVVLILAGVLADRMAKHIVRPLNALDLSHPLESDAYPELAPLLSRVNQLHSQVNAQVRELRRKNDEFAQITGSMREGLILLDDKGMILSINNAAKQLFHTDEACIGTDYLTVERSREAADALQAALENGHSEIRTERNGHEYQFEVSRIASDGAIVGAVLLAFDVTEKVFAERNRREFTANVSHELKTPLQSIMGSAELIENGLVKAEDMPRFVGHIRTEAARLVALIEDILRLSQLDEKSEMPFEEVDLFALAYEIREELEYAAAAKQVTMKLSGEKTMVFGVRKLLAEAVYNLCDNAIKYNREGGSVEITIAKNEKNAIISVKDTGIGIPPEHQDRVFERFYRVDKSHSKESGGTGLGLSIVKHAVQFHRGTVALHSDGDKGSEFVVTLPRRTANASE